MEGNATIPWQIFQERRATFGARWPELRILRIERFAGLCWLLSGGFRKISFLPRLLVKPLLALEEWTLPAWEALGTMRALVVMERLAARASS